MCVYNLNASQRRRFRQPRSEIGTKKTGGFRSDRLENGFQWNVVPRPFTTLPLTSETNERQRETIVRNGEEAHGTQEGLNWRTTRERRGSGELRALPFCRRLAASLIEVLVCPLRYGEGHTTGRDGDRDPSGSIASERDHAAA